MKIVHITPTYFDESSIIGGGERYPTELAISMSKIVDTTLISFSSNRQSYQQKQLKIQVYPVRYLLQDSKLNSFHPAVLSSILQADVIHLHHLNAPMSAIAARLATWTGKRVFVTDYGGGSGLGYKLNQWFKSLDCYHQAIAYSQFGIEQLPYEIRSKSVLIKGGIDTDKFYPDLDQPKENIILYVGRILPHKGINYLIDAFKLLDRSDYKLKIVGRVYDDRYYQDLQQMSAGLAVEFIHDAGDKQLIQEYQRAKVTVLPSVHTTLYGDYTPVPELMGFTLLESQACGTPAICTDAGAMHEFVDEGKTGYVVAQNSGEAILAALTKTIESSPVDYINYQHQCSEWVQPLNWSAVVQQHLSIYEANETDSD
jgi:glycosyltransferase involved in cell wall biosynthesis